MRQTKTQLLAEQKPLGIIDVLTAGFEIVRKRPWTVAIPILFDLALWVLPRLSLTSMFRPVVDQFFPTTGLATDLAPDLVANAKELHDAASQFAASLNLLGLVSAGLDSTARMPTLLGLEGGDVHSPVTALAFTFQLQNGLVAILLYVPLFLLGLFAASIYIEWIAQGVRPLETEPQFAWLARAARLWLGLIGYSALLFLGALISGFTLILGTAFTPLGAGAGSFVTALVAVGWFWLTIYFFFVISAMAVSNSSLLEAVRRSILIVRVYFWATLGLVALTLFLSNGLMLVWRGFAVPDSELGVIFAIFGNDVIGTGLLAAAMVFYQNRMNHMEKLIARARVARRS